MFQLKTLIFTIAFAVFEVYILNQLPPIDSTGKIISSNIIIAGFLTLITLSSFFTAIFSFIIKRKFSLIFGVSLSLFIVLTIYFKINNQYSLLEEIILGLILVSTDIFLI